MVEFQIIDGGRGQSVGETVKWNLRRLKGMDIWDEVRFTTKDGSTRLGAVLDHESDIERSEDGTVRIGSKGEVLIIPVQAIMQVTMRRAQRISANQEGQGGEDFFANYIHAREGMAAALAGDGQEGGGSDNVVRLSDFRGRSKGRNVQ